MSQVISLRTLFEFSGAIVERAAAEKAKESPPMAQAVPTLSGFVAETGAKQLNEALDTDVFELLADAWLAFKQVRECADPVKHPPDQDTVVTLNDVEITSSNSPLLHTTIAGVALPDLRFTLDLTAKFNALQLVVRHARIRALRPGTGSAIVKLKYGSAKLAERSTPDWKLPGEIKLGEDGIAIPAPDSRPGGNRRQG
jgi:hypothetical protein